MVILVCVIVMFNLLMRCSATSPNIINVSVKNGHAALKEEMQPFLMLYKPFTVHVNSDVHLKSIRCSSRHSYIEPFVNAPLDFIKYSSPSTSTSIIYALKTNIYATVEMNDTWYCTLFLDSNETPDLNFNITVTIDKTGSSGVPEQEQWVQADTRIGKSNSIELNRPPFIDIYINKAMDKLVHTTTVKLEWNKSLTITVFVALNVQLKDTLKLIKCYKANNMKQIYLNQPLISSLHTQQQHNYSAVVPSTRNMESSIWTCQLFGPSVSLYKLSFNVSFKYSMPPVTEIPLSNSTPEQNIKSDPKMADVATMPTVKLLLQDNKLTYRGSQNGEVTFNQPFNIEITNNDGPNKVFKSILCKGERHYFFSSKLSRNNNIYTYVEKQAEANMNAMWTCYLMEDLSHNYTVSFKLNVINIPGTATIAVNHVVKVSGGDGAHGNYLYRDGELAKITCTRGKGYYMRFKFSNDDSLTFTSLEATENSVYMKLTDSHNGSFFYCTVLPIGQKNYTIRLEFKRESDTSYKDEPIFHINGLGLTPVRAYDTLKYYYEYYNGEKLSIMGSMNGRNKKWFCEKTSTQLKQVENQEEHINITITLYQEVKPESISMNCQAGQSKTHLSLDPMPMAYTLYPALSGLSSAKTLYKYQVSKNDYKIKYSHPSNTNLNLTCISDVSECEWGNSTNKTNFTYININHRYESENLFMLEKNTTIVCTCKRQTDAVSQNYSTTVEIVIEDPVPITTTTTTTTALAPRTTSTDAVNKTWIGTSPLLSTTDKTLPSDKATTVSIAITGTTKPATVPIATTGTTKPDANSTGQSEESSILPYIWAGTVAATLVVVVLVAFMVRSLIMRKRRQEKEEETNIINYENLPGHNEGAMAMPPQWDDYSQQLQQENPYTYITPPTKNEYAQPKDLRIPETLYAEVGAQSYGTGTVNRGATVYANSEPLKPMPEYSQVVPKNMRKNPSAPQVLPKLKNDNYAQVLPKSERNRPDGSKYTNVFESPRYANMENKTDYAEPAYCEVDAFDKRQ